MGVSAVVDKGQVTNMESAMSKDQKSASSNVDKDQFMTLLVAQMKYQDPLEPTSNTEYISQYATFSELEQMQNMSKSLELSRASELVGKLVTINPTDDNGLRDPLQGQVDSVTYSGNKAYITVDGRTFSAGDVSEVMSDDYANAVKAIEALAAEIDKMPNVNELTLADAGKVDALGAIYDAFSDSTKQLMDSSYVTSLTQLRNRIASLRALEEENAKNAEEDNKETATETETEEVKETEGTAL
ncbi:MAG: hypothetical protein K6C95_09660 [Lachnospiraceae bacterium]|nr:hypothetical protein [Lachnospiraceae bacterium]